MRFFKYLLIVYLVIGCSSKNNLIKTLKQNSSEYIKVSNTNALYTNMAIIFIDFDGNKINFELIEKNNNEDIGITKCKIDKKIYMPIIVKSQLNKKYTIVLKENKKSVNLLCELSNNEIIKLKMRNH